MGNTPSSSRSDPSTQDASLEQNQAYVPTPEVLSGTLYTLSHVFFDQTSIFAMEYRDLDKQKHEKRFSRGDAITLMESIMAHELFHSPKTPPLWSRDQFFLHAIRQSSFNSIAHFMAAMQAVVFQDLSDYTACLLDMKDWDRVIAGVTDSYLSWDPLEIELSDAPLFAILRTAVPQRIGSFDESVWRSIADSIVVAAIICRAKVEPLFEKLILETENRLFVYASTLERLTTGLATIA
ncbi:hypothetical protein PV11_04478 [Exophiala sideris]|uniref:Uncharacterized protein n=1 Tax=Exophiala sideris TaxID=1016849 RepID=A0A0D1YMN0_9EURO|nr:hypothetical protein PV11_04478 [Exophiala sideris]